MPELANRDELEARFAKKFGLVARRHMHGFRELLGDPPDIDNVPESFWEKMQKETENETMAILLLIFGASAELHGWRGVDARLAGLGWASTRSRELGQYWADSTRTRLNDGFEGLTKPATPTESTIDQARETNARIEPETIEIEPEELDDLLDKTFGPTRVAKIAVNETTSARGAGGESAVNALGIDSEEDTWMNPSDSRTCSVCAPLIGQPRSVWIVAAPMGPPPTESECWCRCWINYKNVPA